MQKKNYITPQGLKKLQEEVLNLLDKERPEVVKVVHWAASNGDRSENGDYIYGKKRLREIDKRVRFLTKRINNALVINPEDRNDCEQVFFGATVKLKIENKNQTIKIVGIDEADSKNNKIAWNSPIASNILKCYVGDQKKIKTPSGIRKLEILDIQYKKID